MLRQVPAAEWLVVLEVAVSRATARLNWQAAIPVNASGPRRQM